MATPPLCLSLAGAFVALVICGCAREDEDLQRQIVELRATVQTKAKALEEAQAKTSASPPPANPGSVAELTKAQARVHELEAEVAQLRADLQRQPPPPAPTSMRLDVDVLKDHLEADLTRKAGELRDLVLRQSGVSRIDEISIQRLQLPPEVITPFHSVITFSITDQGRPLRVQFPVTADFSGSWRLPSPDKIQEACRQAREQFASGTPPPAEAPPAPSQVAASADHAPVMKQVNANTFVMDWGDKPAAPSAPAAPSSASPATPRTTSLPPAAPSVPAPVMPVQRDIVIKF